MPERPLSILYLVSRKLRFQHKLLEFFERFYTPSTISFFGLRSQKKDTAAVVSATFAVE
ncbi:hypothetical protein ABIB40_001634 [Pedobacter sp. UYP30]